MAVDTGRLLRIQGAIQATIESTLREATGGSSPFAGKPLAEAYARFRTELLDALQQHPDLVAEVEKMCPPLVASPPRDNYDLFGHRAFTDRAAAALAQLRGWIQGIIDEAEMEANARAYAVAKLKEERGVGFKP